MLDNVKHDGQAATFRSALNQQLDQYLARMATTVKIEDCLKIDLHCHDKNSDVPDELWGRILSLPETWLKTSDLVKKLKSNGCDLVTITNHNNARSCWKLQDKGEDVLVGTEFTCYFAEYELYVHVLAYGFTREQEVILNQKRHNIYEFVRYTREEDIPLILPHPLYFYTRNDHISMELFEKFAVMFQRFEVLNGQRDQWQSVLTLNWLQSLTPDKIREYGKKHNLNPEEFGVDPNLPKVLTGGSDDHMGIFAGESGSLLHIPNLKQKLLFHSKAELALEAIKNGNIVPYGSLAENQKLNIALLDYAAQIVKHIKDPGLMRILFHRGLPSDKLACLVIGNFMMEMQNHNVASKFFEFIHKALNGKKPNKLIKWKVSKDYRFSIDYLCEIADSKHRSPEEFLQTVNRLIPKLYHELNKLIINRIEEAFKGRDGKELTSKAVSELARNFEIPSQLSALFNGKKAKNKDIKFNSVDAGAVISRLSFPLLITTFLMGTTIGSTRLLYANRSFLNDFAEHIGKGQHPKKALYLTDTLKDKNGVSNSLSGKLAYIQENHLPVDFLICHETAESDGHLHVVRPLAHFDLHDFGGQRIRLPDLMQIMKIFYEGGYDRIVCSTEGPMAVAALAIRTMFNVPSYFFMHTDWVEFIKDNTDLTQHQRDRFRRVLRFFYHLFDGVFVLNEDHQEWLSGKQMELPEERVHLTAHHINEHATPIRPVDKQSLFPDATDSTPVMLFSGRLSKEKGVMDAVKVYRKVRRTLPDVRLVFAGTGPAEAELREMAPDAKFVGWVEKDYLYQLYAGLDIKLFPSRFDTFGNVILEAFSCGMPVASYNCKGPKSLIKHNECGFLVEGVDEMATLVADYLASPAQQNDFKLNSLKRAKEYQAKPIMTKFLTDMGLDVKPELVAVEVDAKICA